MQLVFTLYMIETFLSLTMSGALFFASASAITPAVPLTQYVPQNNWVSYAVEKKETLSVIAEKKYGDKEYWTTLWNDNASLQDPESVQEGNLLRVRAQKPEAPDVLVKDLKEKAAAKERAANTYAQVYLPVVVNASSNNLVRASGPLTEEQVNFLGSCEAGLNPAKNTGNGYYGAFQFSHGTWKSMNTGYERADLAPLEVQKDAVQRLVQRSSIFTQFPACASRMRNVGLI